MYGHRYRTRDTVSGNIRQNATSATVDSRQQWQPTGVSVQAGTKLNIQVIAGQWTDRVGYTPHNPGTGDATHYICAQVEPASQCVEPLPTFVKGALIGRIGSSIFGIGSHATILAQQSGVVLLAINDSTNPVDLSDNAGTLTVQITALSPTPKPISRKVVPGGMWISPLHRFVVYDNWLRFAAYAYPTHKGDPTIDHITFTAWLPGGKWYIVKIVSHPTYGNSNLYEYTWNLTKSSVPKGLPWVSFDVYDKAGNKNLAPQGTRQGLIQSGPALDLNPPHDSNPSAQLTSYTITRLHNFLKPDDFDNLMLLLQSVHAIHACAADVAELGSTEGGYAPPDIAEACQGALTEIWDMLSASINPPKVE